MGSINVRSDLAENFERKNVPGFRLAALIPKKFIREIRLLHRRQSFLASTRSWTTGESRIHGKKRPHLSSRRPLGLYSSFRAPTAVKEAQSVGIDTVPLKRVIEGRIRTWTAVFRAAVVGTPRVERRRRPQAAPVAHLVVLVLLLRSTRRHVPTLRPFIVIITT